MHSATALCIGTDGVRCAPTITDHKNMPITVRYYFPLVSGAILWIFGWLGMISIWNKPTIPWPSDSLEYFLAHYVFWALAIPFCGALGPVTVLKYSTTVRITGREIWWAGWLWLYKARYSLDDIVKLERKTTRDNLVVLTITFSDGRKIKADSSGRGFTKFRDYLENYCRDQGREIV